MPEACLAYRPRMPHLTPHYQCVQDHFETFEAEVTYFSKDRKEKKSYDAPEWLAAMGSHVPDRGQQSVRYYCAYAKSTRGRERKRETDDGVPTGLEPDLCVQDPIYPD